VSAPGDVTIREMTPDDVAAGYRLSRASGWNQTEADWRYLLEENLGRFVAALRAGRLIGTGGATCYSNDLAWVCMILVEESERGRGVGSRIVAAVLDRVASMETIGLDATPSGRAVYERLGFTAAAGLVRVGGGADGAAIARGAETQVVEDDDLEAILRFDRDAFGADRSRVIRWARMRAPALAWCVLEQGEPAGYCFGRQGDRAVHLGPVVARSPAIARSLVGSAAAAAPGRDLVLDVPTSPPSWLTALRALGLREQRPFTRMYRAGAPPPGLPDLTLAAFGPELG
jgi:GNAT superfamily N-acetyltransferase